MVNIHTEKTIFNNSRANNFDDTWGISLIIELSRHLVPFNTMCNLGQDWLRNVVSIALTRFKTVIFNNSRANNFCVTGQISLIIELIWDLVSVNTLCNFGPNWFRNVVSIVLTRSKTAIFNISEAIPQTLLGGFPSLLNPSEILCP